MKTFRIVSLLVVLILACFTSPGGAQGQPLRFNPAEYRDGLIEHTKRNPSDGGGWFTLGNAYMGTGQYQEAIAAFQKALAPPSSNPIKPHNHWARIAEAHELLGQFDAAVAAQQRVVTLIPEDPEAYVALARYCYRARHFDDAITAARQAITLQPAHAAAHYFLGAALGEKGRHAEAVTAIRQAIELAPQEVGNYTLLASLYRDMRAYNDALAAHQKAAALAPGDAAVINGLAHAHYCLGRYDESIQAAAKAIELATVPGGIGASFAMQWGLPVVATVVDKSPAMKAGIQRGDWIMEVEGQPTSAWTLDQLVQALQGPAGSQVHLTVERYGPQLKMVLTREKIVFAEAADYLTLRSFDYHYKGEFQKAREDALLAAATAPANNDARLALGRSDMDAGDYAQALGILAGLKGSGFIRLHEAIALAKTGKLREAIDIYQRIKPSEIDPAMVPIATARKEFFGALQPYVEEQQAKAKALEAKGRYREALTELAAALRGVDPASDKAGAIQDASFIIVRKRPALAAVPEEARKFALRSELLVKEGNFREAAAEMDKAIGVAPYLGAFYYNAALIRAELKNYPEAIKNMRTYLRFAPNAPNARAAKDAIIKWEFASENTGSPMSR